MFVTRDRFKHPLSGLMSEPDSSVWRMVDIELQNPWFIAELEIRDEEGLAYLRTMLLSDPDDVLDLAQSSTDALPRLHAVTLVTADAKDRKGGWAMHPLRGIWRAYEPRDPNIRAFLYEKQDGTVQSASIHGTKVEEFKDVECLADFQEIVR